MIDLLQAIRGRRSARDFKQDPVSGGTLFKLLSAASWAPSAMNEQSWHFTIVTDKTVLGEISGRAKTWLLENLPPMPHQTHFRDTLADPDFDIFYNAPSLVVISTVSDGLWMREDAALAAQNLMLMATALGLGSCWIGFAQEWLNTVEGHQLLNLPREKLVVAPIIVGHPRTIPPPVARKPPLVSWIGHRHDHDPLKESPFENPSPRMQ